MSKLTKQLEYQQKVNQEAQKLMKHFGEEVDLKCYYMRMAKTQAQVISLMRVYETNSDPEGEEILVPKDVSLFFMTAAPCSDCWNRSTALQQKPRKD